MTSGVVRLRWARAVWWVGVVVFLIACFFSLAGGGSILPLLVAAPLVVTSVVAGLIGGTGTWRVNAHGAVAGLVELPLGWIILKQSTPRPLALILLVAGALLPIVVSTSAIRALSAKIRSGSDPDVLPIPQSDD